MSNNFQRTVHKCKGRECERVFKVCMTTELMLIDFTHKLCHVQTEVTNLLVCVFVRVCVWLCLLCPCKWKCERQMEREGKRESLFSASGLVDVVKLFMHFCDTTLAALGHSGNNNFWTPDHVQEMTAFVTHLGQLAARLCHGDSPGEQLGSLQQGVTLTPCLHDKHNYIALPCSLWDAGDY